MPRLVGPDDDVAAACAHLSFPCSSNPQGRGDSLGIDEHSHVGGRIESCGNRYRPRCDAALVETYIEGREFTVLVAAGEEPIAYLPLGFVFAGDPLFKTTIWKVTQWHPERNVPCADPDLTARLRKRRGRFLPGLKAWAMPASTSG
ncbi:MAG: hypothetical protein IPL49_13650 [Saprospirales bacterium]|nr:hypothetical protein [Saprospirales bacterium]